MIFESHAHYDDERFDEDREQLLCQMHQAGIGTIVNVGASIASTSATIELAKTYDFVYAAVGVHPSDVDDLNEDTFAWLRTQTAFEKTVAVGEIGLDYYWEKDAKRQENQKFWFRRQLALARETNLPVIIHSREAAAETMQLMRQEHAEEILGVIHCYSYSKEMALEFVKMGYKIGVGGVVTYNNAKKLVETVEAIPMEAILLETDSPYLTPMPHRGKRNSSLYLPHIVEKIAEITGISALEVEQITEQNARTLFRI